MGCCWVYRVVSGVIRDLVRCVLFVSYEGHAVFARPGMDSPVSPNAEVELCTQYICKRNGVGLLAKRVSGRQSYPWRLES